MTTSRPPLRAELARELLGFELGALIDVAGSERRVFVGGRLLDVAVHAAGAAVHDAADAGGACAASSTMPRAVTLTSRDRRIGGWPASR